MELTGQAKPGTTRWLTSTGPGFAHQEAASQVFGWVENRTNLFLQSEPRPIANTNGDNGDGYDGYGDDDDGAGNGNGNGNGTEST